MNILSIRIGNCLRLTGENINEYIIVSDVNVNENKIIIHDKKKGWCLVIPSSKSHFGCKLKPIPHLSDLQNILSPLFTYFM